MDGPQPEPQHLAPSYTQSPPPGSGEPGTPAGVDPYAAVRYGTGTPRDGVHAVAPPRRLDPPGEPSRTPDADAIARRAALIASRRGGGRMRLQRWQRTQVDWARPRRPRWVWKAVAVGVVLLFLAVLFALATWEENTGREALGSYSSPARPAENQVGPGDCFMEFDYFTAPVEAVPCEEPHHYQAVLEVDAPFDQYPGQVWMAWEARDICRGANTEISRELHTSRLRPFMVYPLEPDWDAGDRQITCLIFTSGTNLLQGSHSDGTLEVL